MGHFIVKVASFVKVVLLGYLQKRGSEQTKQVSIRTKHVFIRDCSLEDSEVVQDEGVIGDEPSKEMNVLLPFGEVSN